MIRITWVLIVLSLVVLGGYAGYLLRLYLEPAMAVVEESAPETTEVVSETAMVDGEPDSLTHAHLTDAERRSLMRELLDANRTEPLIFDDPAPGEMQRFDPEEGTDEADESDVSRISSASVIAPPLYPAAGHLLVYETATGTILRFEELSTLRTPFTHLYLARELNGTDAIDLGPIRGTEGAINYRVHESVDLSAYRYVMHWVVPYEVVLNYVDLQEGEEE